MTEEFCYFEIEELLTHSRSNFLGVLMVSVRFLKKNGIDINEYASYLGKNFTAGWEKAKEYALSDIVRSIARNYASAGADEIKITGEDDEKKIILKAWPKQEYLEYYKVSQEDFDRLFNMHKPIAEFLGLTYSHKRDGDTVTVTIKK